MAKGERKIYHTIRYGQRDGEIKFGHIHDDNNESAAMLRSGHDWTHYITMDHTGNEERKHGTMCRSKGSFKVKAGDNCLTTPNNVLNQAGIVLDSVSGDIIIKAPQGKIKLQAQDIELIANGNAPQGVIWANAYETLKLDSKNVTIDGKQSLKVMTSGLLALRGSLGMQMLSPLIEGVSRALTKDKLPEPAETNSKSI